MIGVMKDRRARLSSLQSAVLAGGGEPIGGLVEGMWQVAAGKIGTEITACAQVPRADPSRG